MATNPADDDVTRVSPGPTQAGAGGAMAPGAAIAFPATLPPGEAAAARPEALGHMLPSGSRLRDYEITGLIGEGGFGIVYLAWDHSLQRRVAIKEYMPASMASRLQGSASVVVKSERHLDTFKAGLKSFVNEARLLARFDHPSLVKVYRFWEDNGTAYMVMPFYEGPTLKAALAALGHIPSEAELRAWLAPLLDALAVMHAAQCFHRDIAPDNILLTASGPLLLDFGAARRVIGDMTHALTVVLKPGYAPIEQYGEAASMTQGAWTDLYALGCVVYYAITGRTPMSSVERLMDDRLEPLSTLAAGRYSPAFLAAIDAALAVRPQDRPQDDASFRALLDADRPMPPTAPLPSPVVEHGAFAPTERYAHPTVPGTLTPVLPTQALPRQAQPGHAPAAAGSSPPLEPTLADAGPPALVWPAPAPPASATPVQPATTTPARLPRVVAVLVLLVLLGAAGVAVWLWWLPTPRAVTPAAVPSSPPASATLPATSSSNAPIAAPTATPAPATPAPMTPVPVTPAPVTPAPATIAPNPPQAAPPKTDATPAAATTMPAHPSRPATTTEVAPSRRATTRAAAPAPAEAPRHRPVGARCSDILQKASLEPLTSEEEAYLKRECQ